MEENTKQKRGRKPLFTSYQVDEIQKAEGTIEELATRYRTSRQTIARIRSNYYEYAPMGSDQSSRTHPVPNRKKRAPVNEAKRRAIAADMRTIREVADFYGVSKVYVSVLRAKYGMVNRPGPMVHPDVEFVIRNSDKTIEELAKQFEIPAFLIERIKGNGEENKT